MKIWRPAAQDRLPPQTLGVHSDYVKCLASPGPHASWVASGGLDRKICLWDLQGQGERLQINVGEDNDTTAKGSVYALAATPTIIASGGPESIVRVWDPRSGQRITKLVGHTDNIRDVLVAQDGDTIMTASSDQTVKVWSMTAGRCMYTLTMHNDSVWSLHSDHPRLLVFYSSDRSGLVAKTDCRGFAEMDEGLSVAVAKEHEGVNKVIQAGDYLWTSTSSSSVNRWLDVDTEADAQFAETMRSYGHRSSIVTTRTRGSVSLPSAHSMSRQTSQTQPQTQSRIPLRSLLRTSNAAPYYSMLARELDDSGSLRKNSEPMPDLELGGGTPMRTLPDYTIEGQNGLIKHHMLNDRRRVLTIDTAGEVMMWDLLQCRPVRAFGKRHLEDVIPEVNTTESIAPWCTVDTRTGSLTCVLEENYCFDAEMYADELTISEHIEFREDQRINLGKWVLRYLFASLIDEEIRRDETYRKQLLAEKGQLTTRDGPPRSIQIPPPGLDWSESMKTPTSAATVRASNGHPFRPVTPGAGIAVATPGPAKGVAGQTSEDGAPLSKIPTAMYTSTPSAEKNGANDYFSAVPLPTKETNGQAEAAEDGLPQSPSEPAKKKGTFGKKFGMNMSFNMKKLGRVGTNNDAPKPAPETATEEKSEDSDSRSSNNEPRTYEDNLLGCVQKLRQTYEEEIHEAKDREPGEPVTTLASAITPSLPNDTPVLKPPPSTTILIQEDRPTAGGVADLFEGTVSTLSASAVDRIEKVAPYWLGDVLLRNIIPTKEIVKVAFILEPLQGSGLPVIASDGNNRLNANRMLRARKVLAYVAERIEPKEAREKAGMRPEEYLELYCQGQVCMVYNCYPNFH